MSYPIILSDEDNDDPNTPFQSLLPKKPRPTAPTIFLVDDDDDNSTPQKPPLPSPFLVPETPFSDIPNVKSLLAPPGGICLEDDAETVVQDADVSFSPSPLRFLGSKDIFGDSRSTHGSGEGSSQCTVILDDVYQVEDYLDKENFGMEKIDNIGNADDRTAVTLDRNDGINEALIKKKMTKEERDHLKEERKLKKEEEKMQKATLKAKEKQKKASLKVQAAELKKMENEKKKWETGKFALKSIVAEVDTKVVEQGSVGGHLLTKFSEKNLAYRITSNPIEHSIVWRMNLPETISQLPLEGTEIRYALLVYEAEEFCNLVANELVLDHVSRVRSYYPSYTICYLTNRLMACINKRERERYKKPEIDDGWRCPPIEEVLAKFTTHYHRVHHRQCRDEAELAEHVVGLTCSLASCQYRAKLTRLSVSANGLFLPKDCIDRNLIKKNPWLKALVAIPKVQPRYAIAIWKKYPTMKSLLSEYMDPNKSVHEKEFVLQDLTVEGLLGGERRVGQICSKRVYRILMAKSGSIRTDDVEDGADLFGHQPL